MNRISVDNRKLSHILMIVLIITWGLEFVIVKDALKVFEPLCLLNFKYIAGIFVLGAIKFVKERNAHIRNKDIPLFLLCSFFGEVIYFYCDYKAMSYMPISLITIMLAFMPVVSVLIERVLYKRKVTKLILGSIIVSTFGVALIIGVDIGILLQGRIIGYLLCFIAILSWNFYNFLTASLSDRYTTITLTTTQLLCTILLTLPYATHYMPPFSSFTASVIGGIIYLGVVSAGIGTLILVQALRVLGPTTTALYSNFLPVTSAFFGWLFYRETISAIQMIGGIIVISAGYIVIKEKGKLDEFTRDV